MRKIVEKVPDELLQQDLEKYRQRALELGATDAKIITSDMILVDERVRAKCIYPLCPRYGQCANCPPYAMDIDQIRRIVNKFQYAVFINLEAPSEEIAGREAVDKKLFVRSRIKNHEIVSKIEAEAYYDGYHLAIGFAGGACLDVFCLGSECSALIPGQGCRHGLRARNSVEGVGIDAFTMAAKVGWDVYPLGRAISPSEVPHGTNLGLVLIY